MSWRVSGGTASAPPCERAARVLDRDRVDRDRVDGVRLQGGDRRLLDREVVVGACGDVAQVEGRARAAGGRDGHAEELAVAAGRDVTDHELVGGDSLGAGRGVVGLPVLRHEQGRLVVGGRDRAPGGDSALAVASPSWNPGSAAKSSRTFCVATDGRAGLTGKGRPGGAGRAGGGGSMPGEQWPEAVREARRSGEDQVAGGQLHVDREAGRARAIEREARGGTGAGCRPARSAAGRRSAASPSRAPSAAASRG